MGGKKKGGREGGGGRRGKKEGGRVNGGWRMFATSSTHFLYSVFPSDNKAAL